MTLTLECTFDQ